MNKIPPKRLTTSQIIICGFAGAILFGALVLMLPISSASGRVTPFSDALFTATSAICVTGLVVQNTATYWSVFGQAFILFMIQIGGLGIVTMAVSIAMLSGRRIGLMQRSTLQEAISAPAVGGIVRLTGFILRITFSIELIGAVLMSPVLCRDFGAKGIFLALFHSVSAFCNAGFDLMGTDIPFSSLTRYTAQPLINTVVMLLIIIGGIGFLVWDDIKTNRWHIRKYRLQTKVVLTTTLILILLPAVYFYLAEFQGLSGNERVLAALFQSVTTRTAGFNTTDLTALGSTGKAITVFLMLIGGSPGSTAGGMKTTTVAVMLFTMISAFRKKESVECFGRRLPHSIVRNAAAIFFMYLILFTSGAFIMRACEGLPLSVCLFETASAIGTVGLSLGITPHLGTVSRIILIVLMYFGRVGGLTLIFAALTAPRNTMSKKPEEKITVG